MSGGCIDCVACKLQELNTPCAGILSRACCKLHRHTHIFIALLQHLKVFLKAEKTALQFRIIKQSRRRTVILYNAIVTSAFDGLVAT